jgi:hypothetical protein
VERRTLVGSTAAVAVIPLLSHAGFAQTAPKAKNVVPVHGLFADGSSRPEVIPRLEAAGLASGISRRQTATIEPREEGVFEYYGAPRFERSP